MCLYVSVSGMYVSELNIQRIILVFMEVGGGPGAIICCAGGPGAFIRGGRGPRPRGAQGHYLGMYVLLAVLCRLILVTRAALQTPLGKLQLW